MLMLVPMRSPGADGVLLPVCPCAELHLFILIIIDAVGTLLHPVTVAVQHGAVCTPLDGQA